MFEMIVVIIAGGSGTRLWPLSTPSFPKHLLSLADDDSLLQNTFTRARKLTSDDKILVITDVSHSQHVIEQLSDLDTDHVLIELARRGTANCILFAMQHVHSNYDADEPVAILWADHIIRDQSGFAATFKHAANLSEKHNKVVFIGVEPTYPSTGLGYMEHGVKFDNEESTYKLVSFHEKPDKDTALTYIESGKYFWNTGYLVMTLNSFKEATKAYAPDYLKTFEALCAAPDMKEAYLDLKSDAIDYVFSVKVKSALVIPGNFDWVDIGSFKDLHEISPQDESGNYVKGEGIELDTTTNSYIRNDGTVPVAVIGLDNVVVINTPNGILVTNKNYAQKVGDVAKKLQQ
jgi:mannose-1-phosphate guanylyltransferase/mannose-6-phosphate isomerase